METRLDADELLHLALAATDQDRPDDSINYLKKGLEIAPNDGRLYYLLGAVHAELGMYDRAIEEMGKAVELAPGLNTAHFQLGLLHLTSGNVPAADAAWKPLDDVGLEDPLRLFKTGLLHLVRDEFEKCVDHLRRGIERNTMNEQLNHDMQRVIGEAEKVLRQRSSTPAAPVPAPQQQGKRAFLSAYQGDNDETAPK